MKKENVKDTINIIVIGNGFDLYHKLPTRYSDFLFFVNHWKTFKELNDNASIDINPITKLNISLSDEGKLTEKSIEDFAKYKYSKDDLKKFDMVCSNKWIKYFNCLQISGEKWIDFENEILRSLLCIQDYVISIPDIYKTYKEKQFLNPDKINYIVKTFSEDIPWCPYGSVKQNEFENLSNDKKKLLDKMKKELDDLNLFLNKYLSVFVERINCNYYSSQIEKLLVQQDHTYLLNFNYTNTFEEIYHIEIIEDFHNIHGCTHDNNIVLGVADDQFNDTIDYIYFQKYFQRIQKRTGNKYLNWLNLFIDNDYKIDCDLQADSVINVCFFGHSLGESDKGALTNIFQNNNVEHITIFYHSQRSYEELVINLVKMFGKDFVIQGTANGRIIFKKLEPPTIIDEQSEDYDICDD